MGMEMGFSLENGPISVPDGDAHGVIGPRKYCSFVQCSTVQKKRR
jgi:hypothetical protein